MALARSQKSSCVMQSEIRNMSLECTRVGGLNLSQGVCDTEVPEVVRRAAQEAIDDGFNIYTRYDGLQQLREALSRKLKRQGIEADPESQLVVSAGATGVFYSACLALLNSGDEVILFEPYYGYHVSTLKAVDAVPTYVTLHAPDWHFSPQDLERARTSKTRAILVNTPANPSGKVFTREELAWIAAFAQKHDLFIFTDEIYEYFVNDGREHFSPLAMPEIRPRVIGISGLSKTFSITGWRIGYAVCDARWAQTLGYFSDLVYICAPSPLQIGVARGLDALDPEYYKKLAQEYQRKRDQCCAALEKAGLKPYVPQGAYYILADTSKIPGKTSKERAMYLLKESGVACVPGEAFYHRAEDGVNLARFCYAKKRPDLDEACRRLEAFGKRH